MDAERFLQARKEALGRVGGAGGIGTLSEKALHAALKSYYEPDFESREVKVGGFVADIVGENGIVEIQTRGFDRLRRKLDAFLEAARVTVVYPVVPKRGLCWVDPETGEIFEKRKSPKKGATYDVFPELYKIKNQLMHPNFRLCIPLLEVTDYKYLDGYGKQKKLRATRGGAYPGSVARRSDLRKPVGLFEFAARRPAGAVYDENACKSDAALADAGAVRGERAVFHGCFGACG